MTLMPHSPVYFGAIKVVLPELSAAEVCLWRHLNRCSALQRGELCSVTSRANRRRKAWEIIEIRERNFFVYMRLVVHDAFREP